MYNYNYMVKMLSFTISIFSLSAYAYVDTKEARRAWVVGTAYAQAQASLGLLTRERLFNSCVERFTSQYNQIDACYQGGLKVAGITEPTPAYQHDKPNKNSYRKMETKKLQQMLKDAGYDPGPVDGVYGKKTKQAYEAYKQVISKAAEWLINEQIVEGCDENSKGQFAPNSIFEQDLTGDGQKDLIIDHGGLNCLPDRHNSMNCGVRACSVLFYVREGNLLIKKKEILSIGVSVEAGNPPIIHLMSHDYLKSTVRWNGYTFK